MPVRVHELAKELKISTSALRTHLNGMGIVVKSHMSPIDDVTTQKIRMLFNNEIEKSKIKSTSENFVFEGILSRICSIQESNDSRATGLRLTGGIKVIRGYAPIKKLAECSEANFKYQREAEENHTNSLTKFFNDMNPGARFVPEIVLSAFGVSFKLEKIQQERVSETFDFYSFELLENDKLKRIDGNHRLESAKSIKNNLIIAFSIILPEEIETDDAEQSDIDIENESFIFYFLNGKAKKLLPVEMYKGLLDAQYSEHKDLNLVNPILVPLKKAWDELESFYFHIPNVNEMIKPLVNVFEKMELEELNSIDFQEKFTYANFLIQDIENGDRYSFILLSIGSIFYDLVFYICFKEENLKYAKKKFYRIVDWLEQYKFYDESFDCPKRIYDIVERLHNRKFKIFYAMPFYSEHVVKEYKKIANEVKKLIEMNGCFIDFNPMMINNEGSFNINEAILKGINDCDIFIADITDNNPNVLYEFGIAKALDKNCILIIREDSPEPKFDIKPEYFEKYKKDAPRETLKPILLEHLKGILTKYYGVVVENYE